MIIFARTRHNYDSYQDFWELVELSEFPFVYIDEIDWGSNNTYILTPHNGEVPNPLPSRNCLVIWLNIERPGNYSETLWEQFNEVWVCDLEWSKKTNSRFFFMASDERLGYTGKHNLPAVTLAYLVGRRVGPYSRLNLNNRNGCFGKEKKELLANAKALVVLHQDVPVMSPQRFCYSAAAHLPIFYEELPEFYPYTPYKDFIPITLENCESVVSSWLEKEELQQIGENLFNKMCIDTNFTKEVKRMFK